MLAADNSGEETVERYRGIPPYKETRDYVQRITGPYTKVTHPYLEEVTRPSAVLGRITEAAVTAQRYDQLHELLAEVFAFEQGDQRARRIVEPVDDRFAVLELALGTYDVSVWQRVSQRSFQSKMIIPCIRMRLTSTDRNPRIAVGSFALYSATRPQMTTREWRFISAQRGVEHRAADVLEIDVDAVRTCGPQIRVQISRTMSRRTRRSRAR